MDKRTIIYLAVGIVVVFIFLSGGFLWRQGYVGDREQGTMPSATEEPSEAGALPGNTNGGENGTIPTAVNVAPSRQLSTDEADALRVARFFASRFGTFSNHEQFIGVKGLFPLMTTDFSKFVQTRYLPGLMAAYDNEVYKGQTTQVLGTDLEEVNDATATVTVRIQRVHTDAAGTQEVSYHTQRVELVKIDAVWLIDAIYTDQ